MVFGGGHTTIQPVSTLENQGDLEPMKMVRRLGSTPRFMQHTRLTALLALHLKQLVSAVANFVLLTKQMSSSRAACPKSKTGGQQLGGERGYLRILKAKQEDHASFPSIRVLTNILTMASRSTQWFFQEVDSFSASTLVNTTPTPHFISSACKATY
ncbi:hypothetical protein L1987_11002 [Smallanthus sonchifolius]|uniref:Uncharacterized protein n=1 Tax=Smallanthus sonchifolius TaxID=185202 RepID=A0ACB9JB87_9ASTR|nr:hypothetical protein L1987_11002 [Smallanthus sonchifolius]